MLAKNPPKIRKTGVKRTMEAIEYVTQDLAPNDVFKLFEDISKIARPTGEPKNQSAIIDFISNTLREHDIATRKDEAGNLYAYKSATEGCESVPGILFQAHVDMVCAPNEDIFPLKLVVENGYLHADGTSCGLDNGMGVALAMSLLINSPKNHGKLEAAFTLNEDTDCYGAINMKSGYVTSKYMISLDDESWGKICIGSAGAEAYTHTLPFKAEPVENGQTCLSIKVSGLSGGHSGYSIHKRQANAIAVCAWILEDIITTFENDNINLVSINGGVADNAIPYECEMVIAVASQSITEITDHVAAEASEIKSRFANTDKDMIISVEKIDRQATCLNYFATKAFVDSIATCPNGALEWHKNDDGSREIQTSSNLAIVKTETDRIIVRTLSRSSVESELAETVNDIKNAFARNFADATSVNHSAALCWEPDWDSKFLQIAKDVFKQQNGTEAEIYAPHCYMEGAYFVKIHGLLPIALGPQIDGAHTVEERVNIETVGKCRKLVVGIVESIAKRENGMAKQDIR